MDYHKFIQATLQLGQAAAKRHSPIAAAEQEAVDAIERGEPTHAITAIKAVLARKPDAARWWHELASIHRQGGDAAAADAAWQQALCHASGDVPLLHGIGRSLHEAGHDPALFAQQALASKPSRSPAHGSSDAQSRSPELNEACLDVLRNDCTKALPVFKKQMEDDPANQQTAANLAFLLESLGRHGQAQCVLALNQLARGHVRAAIEAFEAAPAADRQSPGFLANYLRALRLADEGQRAIHIAKAALPADTRAARLEWANAQMDLGQPEAAAETLRQGAAALDDPSLELHADLILPAVPASQAEMDQAHRRVCHAIRALPSRPLPDNPEALVRLERVLGPNFFLPYLGKPYVEEARAYGGFVERVMQARFPQFSQPRPARDRDPGARVRIGCASSHANHHVVMKCFAGWLEHANRDDFELHLFPLATEKNDVTGYLASLVDTCHPSATETAEAARQIYESELDLLVYPEIGLDPLSFRLAAIRLAPVQCVAGGHPATSGLSTLDYFLSAEAAEPADAAEHYTERLVTLPGMGLCMPFPGLPAKRKSRGDFGLAPDQVVYFSPQGLFKYLPRHDELFARIAESVDNSVFVFVEGHYPAWTRTFSERLRRSFEFRGLSADRHVKFVPRQDYNSFLCLNTASDIFLDPPGGWSGGMTVRDALACGLPVVTVPGTLMRTRQGFGLLTELGIEDTIAKNTDDYVNLAVRLGNDAKIRATLSRRIREKNHLLFDDTRSVAALAALFRQATEMAKPETRHIPTKTKPPGPT